MSIFSIDFSLNMQSCCCIYVGEELLRARARTSQCDSGNIDLTYEDNSIPLDGVNARSSEVTLNPPLHRRYATPMPCYAMNTLVSLHGKKMTSK